jgi:hypothetical protein
MSSIISDIYDELRTITTATLSGYVELPDAYELESNPSIILGKSWAIGFEDESNDNRYICGILSLTRTFQIVVINRITTTQHNTSARRLIEKALIDDAYLIIKALLANPTLNSKASSLDYTGQTGLSYLTDANGSETFVSTALTFGIQYQETY